MGKTDDTRLSIDLGSLRQDIWTNGTEENIPTDSLVQILRASSYDETPDFCKVKEHLARARMNAIPSV
eukprot:6016564-Pyramimonas_sp.AAC.2